MKLLANVSFVALVMSTHLATGCSGNSAPPSEPSAKASENVTSDAGDAPSPRAKMTEDECKAKGSVVYDMGDGKTHAPSYRCADGRSPIGTIPLGREGAVCCPK